MCHRMVIPFRCLFNFHWPTNYIYANTSSWAVGQTDQYNHLTIKYHVYKSELRTYVQCVYIRTYAPDCIRKVKLDCLWHWNGWPQAGIHWYVHSVPGRAQTSHLKCTQHSHGAYFKYNTLHLAYGFMITRENSPFKNMWIDVKGHPLLVFNEWELA